jgi:hypothetical protein
VGEQRHLDAPMVLAGDLALAHQHQRLARRQVRAHRLVEEIVALVADARELQPRQHLVRAGWSAHPELSSRAASEASPDRGLVLGELPQRMSWPRPCLEWTAYAAALFASADREP